MKITIDLPDEPCFFQGIPCPVEIRFDPFMPTSNLNSPDGKLLTLHSDGSLRLTSQGESLVGNRHGVAPMGHGDIYAGKWAWLITRGHATMKVAQ